MTKNSENITIHKQIMLVDDSSIDNFVNRKIIQGNKFASEIIEFTQVRFALKYLLELNNDLESTLPSLLFLDLDIPEIDGFEFLEAFNLLSERMKKAIKIVILTSSINPADIERCSKHKSVIAFSHKPLMKNNLIEIEKLLSEKKEKLADHPA